VSAIAVAVLALSVERQKIHLGVPLSLLALDQFAWNLGLTGYELTLDSRYLWAREITAPFFVPLALHFVLTFTAKRTRFRPVLIGAYLVFGAESVFTLLHFTLGLQVSPDVHSLLLGGTGVPVGVLAMALVWRRASEEPDDRTKAWILLVAVVAVTLLLPTDLAADMGYAVPRLANVASLVFNVALVYLLPGMDSAAGVRRVALPFAGLIALLIVIAYLGLFAQFQRSLGVLVLTMTVLTLGIVALARVAIRSFTHEREMLERKASASVLSPETAHDLIGRLRAARNAVELMKTLGTPDQQALAALAEAQLGDSMKILDRHRRLTTLQLERRELDLSSELAMKAASLQAMVGQKKVELRTELLPSCPHIEADLDLLVSAVTQLVSNACDAMPPEGGQVTVKTTSDGGHLVVAVHDTGSGMDARDQERVERGFTTKPTGTGIGLAFVQDVAKAHGGTMVFTSKKGVGTTVEVRLPLEVHHG
jgi:signal transduction histidine kinase